jgi:predicted amidophosphoribosyltransferase
VRINPPRLPRDPAICPRCGKKREPEAGVLCRACRSEFDLKGRALANRGKAKGEPGA